MEVGATIMSSRKTFIENFSDETVIHWRSSDTITEIASRRSDDKSLFSCETMIEVLSDDIRRKSSRQGLGRVIEVIEMTWT